LLIQCGYDIAYECTDYTPMLAMLHIRPERQHNLTTPERFAVLPYVPYRTYLDGFGNVCTRLVMPPGVTHLTCDFTIWDPGTHDPVPYGAPQTPVDQLPDDVLVYLLGSRYCDTDEMSDLAWALFGNGPTGWQRVQAVCDYAHARIVFNYQHASSTRTASGAHRDQRGVCRDYAHLAVTLCRCLNIPARYCTGFLGDMGTEPPYGPMDFAAWFDVYLDGAWHTFDARNNVPRIGRILLARGRDATDVAIATTFGPCVLAGFTVITDEMPL
jgi:transglutaminase-like putative cysteine protease